MGSPRADWYDRAATRDLVGHSALHVAWAAGVAADREVLAPGCHGSVGSRR